MKLYAPDDTQILDIVVDDESYAYSELMGRDDLTLIFSLAEYVEIPVGSWCEFGGTVYTMLKPESLTLRHRRNFEYTLTMHTSAERLRSVMFQNPDDYRLKFTATGSAADHLSLLRRCLTAKDGSAWTSEVSESVTGDKTVSYDFVNCREALSSIAEAFDTEYEVEGLAIRLGKVEHGKDAPISMSYGRGNGFLSGVKRTNHNDETPLTKVYVQGSDRNIDFSKYGSKTLHMPPGAALRYDGSAFGSGDEYRVDANGYGVSLSGAQGLNEGALDCTHIYPSRVGTVSGVIVADEGKHFYDIVDDSIPESLDYSQCRITGEKMTIVFQSGMLAGREFDIATDGDGGLMYDHAERRFEIVPAELDGFVMPGGAYVPAVGDTYAVFHCSLPDAYTRDDAGKTGASWDLFREAVRYLHEHSRSRYSVSGTMDGIWSKARWTEIGAKIRPGGYVSFTDQDFMAEPFLVRFQSVKKFINRPHSPEIQLSNSPSRGGVVSSMRRLRGEDLRNEERVAESVEFSRRRFRDAQETVSALAELVEGMEFDEGIRPITVETMMMLIGDRMLQYEFVESMESTTPVSAPITWDSVDKKLICGTGYIWHKTFDLTALTNQVTADDGRRWKLAAATIGPTVGGVPLNPDAWYYLYAKVRKTNTNGGYIISSHTMPEGDNTYWYLLIGILNSEYEGSRSFATMYGFTEIAPGRMTVNRIQNPAGTLVIDLLNATIKGKITFTSGDAVDTAISDAQEAADGAASAAASTQSALNTFVEVTYPDDIGGIEDQIDGLSGDIGGLQGQVDGKIESWFQSSNPATAWTTSELKAKHVGDMWYNPTAKSLKRYSSSYAWEEIQDQKAIDAYALASTAKDTADGKRRVFVTTPVPPYDIGDLWLNGTDLRRSTADRAAWDSYNPNDWIIPVYYDNTQTVIDGGIVTSGTMQVAGSSEQPYILAGITGQGTAGTSIRFWAGAAFENRATAPFRVQQDGTFFANHAFIEGDVRVNGAIRSPFRLIDWTTGTQGALSANDFHDNILVDPHDPTDPDNPYVQNMFLVADVENIGRRVTIVPTTPHKFYVRGVKDGSVISSDCFFENGAALYRLTCENESVELIGVGDPIGVPNEDPDLVIPPSFSYWMVVRRTSMAPASVLPLNVLAYGKVTGQTSNGSCSRDIKTFDGMGSASVSVVRASQGIYSVTFPSDWGILFLTAYMVMLTGYGAQKNVSGSNAPVKATLYSRSTSSFTVHVSDHDGLKDGDFEFLMFRN